MSLTTKRSFSEAREEEEQRKEIKIKKAKKYALIGAASVGGGVLLGLTGGLVAPLLGASLGALIGIIKRGLRDLGNGLSIVLRNET